MQNQIIIIESPNKREKIEKITGARVYATRGHFKTLAKDFLKEYEKYEPIFEFSNDETKARLNKIFSDCKGKDIIIATDPDREGYGIGYMFYQTIKNIARSVKRAEFHEITESGIKKGLENSKEFAKTNLNDYEAFKARIVGDKLVGFLLSPKYINLLNDKNTSVGRVQTPALSLIVKREKEIQEFLQSKESQQIDYRIKVKLQKENLEFFASNDNLYSTKEEALEKIQALKVIENSKVYKIEIKKSETKPPMPFRTSQFQENANKLFGLSSEDSMQIAQKLFEKGLITYHRTDSNSLSLEFLDEIEKHFKNKEWYQKKEYKAGNQSQAQAHEAIRISHIHEFDEIKSIIQKEGLGEIEEKVYTMIYANSILSQAKNALYEIYHYDFDIKGLSFKTSIKKCIYAGYKNVFNCPIEEEEEEEEKMPLEFKEGEEIKILDYELVEVKKKAPQRYKESNFISLLEKEGIGRPSTYAGFLQTLLKREYVQLAKKGKNSEIIATKKGISLIESLNENKEEWITTSEFTKQMENILDFISKGECKYLDFIKPLHEKMQFAELNSKEQKPPTEKQIEFAEKLAKNHNLELPQGYKEDYLKCSNFIETALKNAPRKPTEKQIEFAKKLSNEKNIPLPVNYQEDYKVCEAFISKILKGGKF